MKRIAEITLNVLTVLAALSSVVVWAAVVRREWFKPPATATSGRQPIQVANWAKIASGGHRMGPVDATVTIVAYSDFQCPFCKQLELGQLRRLRAEFPQDFAIVYKHWPLPNHKYSYAMARGALCADAQGRFEQFHDRVFEQQDSISVKPVTRFAADIGIPDPVLFDRCTKETAPLASVATHIAEVRELGGMGTPSVVVNGYFLPGGADSAVIDSLTRSAIRRKRGA